MNCAKTTGYPYEQILNHDLYLTPHTHIQNNNNLNWIIDLNKKMKTKKKA